MVGAYVRRRDVAWRRSAPRLWTSACPDLERRLLRPARPSQRVPGRAAFLGPLLSLQKAVSHDPVSVVALTPYTVWVRYAFYGDDLAWSDLGSSPQFVGQLLYVGKAERSLNGRDVGTHFAVGKTGSSTVRRSLAALLTDELALDPVPRNSAKPDGSANFALNAASEARLSSWMEKRLSLATWVKSADVTLDEIETVIVRRLRPPLNLDKVGESREHLRRARKRMADVSRA